jgi:hypothetical protein
MQAPLVLHKVDCKIHHFFTIYHPHNAVTPSPQVMERSLTFLHRQTAILRAALEPLTETDRQRLKAHGLGSSSLGNGMVSSDE